MPQSCGRDNGGVMHEWFHSFYRSEEIRFNPVSGKFGVFYRPIGYSSPSWWYRFSSLRSAMNAIDVDVELDLDFEI
jgi:hypothetical protein